MTLPSSSGVLVVLDGFFALGPSVVSVSGDVLDSLVGGVEGGFNLSNDVVQATGRDENYEAKSLVALARAVPATFNEITRKFLAFL